MERIKNSNNNKFLLRGEPKNQDSAPAKQNVNLAHGSMRTEQWQCYCQNCKRTQVEVVSYQEGQCNHILHAIITVLTFFWAVGWLIIYLDAQKTTARNRRLAIAEKKCDQCGNRLVPLND